MSNITEKEALKCNMLGSYMWLTTKILKHIEQNNPERVKDYLTKAYDGVDPSDLKNHPAYEVIHDGMIFLRNNGWKVGKYDWGEEKGIQMTCVSPNNEWYRSRFNHFQ